MNLSGSLRASHAFLLVLAITTLPSCGGGGGESPAPPAQPAPVAIVPGLTLLAGTITPGTADIDGSVNARFSTIDALAADSSGTFYVADHLPSDAGARIRKVSADGQVVTLASASGGYPDGDLSRLGITQINQITATTDGSLYFSDVQRLPVTRPIPRSRTYFRKLGRDGSITLLGSTTDTHSDPMHLIIGSDGTLYAYDAYGIYTLDGNGNLNLFAGHDSSGSATDPGSPSLNNISDIQPDHNGGLYAIDSFGLRQVSKAGKVSMVSDSSLGIGAPMTVDRNGNLLFTATLWPSAYQVLQYGAGQLSTLYTVGTADGASHQTALHLLAMSDGSVVTADYYSLTRISTDGTAKLLAGMRDDFADHALDGQGSAARLISPGLLAADHQGNIYSVEQVDGNPNTGTIRKITPDGAVTTFANTKSTDHITGLAVTPDNALVVSVRPNGEYGGALYRVEQGSQLTLLAGPPVPGGDKIPQQADGQGSAARFGVPVLAGVDSAGNLYVRDQATLDSTVSTIRKISPQGVVSTVSSLPSGLGVAPDGNVYQINAAGSGVLRIAPNGTTTLVAGTDAASYANIPGNLPAKLYQARSIVALDAHTYAVAAGNGIYKLVLAN